MTLIFGYFQYFDYELLVAVIIPRIILAIFSVILNYFIIRSSQRELDEKDKPELLFYIGIINIAFFIIPLSMPTITQINPTDFDKILTVSYVVLLGLMQSLPFFITYGVLLFRFGRINEARYHIYLKMTSILWIISNGFKTIIIDNNLFTVINILTDYSLSYGIISIFLQMSAIFGIIDLVGWGIFIVHSVKNKDNNLLIAGVLRLIAFVAVTIYNLFLPSLLWS